MAVYMKVSFKINKEDYGQRLDLTLSKISYSWSRNYASNLIKSGHIRVSGQRKKTGYRLKPGDIITGMIPDSKDDISILPEALDIDILHEDNHILVVNKRAGMVVHPAPGNFSGTLVNALLYYFPEIKSVGENPLRPGIVHRLDKDTTGIMVIAKNSSAFNFLKNEFKQRRVFKQYLCLVTGNIKENAGRVIFPIGRNRIKRKRMSVNAPHSKHAETLWRVRKRFNVATFLEAELKTGRTHQIRVHFRSLGHPLVGDVTYGFKIKRPVKNKNPLSILEKNISRQMLHSWKLGMRHPFSGRKINFTAPVPHDMKQVLSSLSAQRHQSLLS